MALRCPPDRSDASPTIPLAPAGGHTDGDVEVTTDLRRLAPRNVRRRSLVVYADPANTDVVRVLLSNDGGSSKGFPIAAGGALEVLNAEEVRAYSESGTQTVHLITEVD